MPTKSAKPPMRIDRLQPLVVARAKALGLTAYAISQRCEGNPTPETVSRFLGGMVSVNSANLTRILRALGWSGELKWAK